MTVAPAVFFRIAESAIISIMRGISPRSILQEIENNVTQTIDFSLIMCYD